MRDATALPLACPDALLLADGLGDVFDADGLGDANVPGGLADAPATSPATDGLGDVPAAEPACGTLAAEVCPVTDAAGDAE